MLSFNALPTKPVPAPLTVTEILFLLENLTTDITSLSVLGTNCFKKK